MPQLWSRFVTRTIAVLIIAGALYALFGIGARAFHVGENRFWFRIPLRILPIVMLWVASAAIGAWLWFEAAAARKWAMALLALQTPIVISVPFTLVWYSLAQLHFSLVFRAEDTLGQFGARLGSGIIYATSKTPGVFVGVNAFALACLVLLLRTRPTRPPPPATGNALETI